MASTSQYDQSQQRNGQPSDHHHRSPHGANRSRSVSISSGHDNDVSPLGEIDEPVAASGSHAPSISQGTRASDSNGCGLTSRRTYCASCPLGSSTKHFSTASRKTQWTHKATTVCEYTTIAYAATIFRLRRSWSASRSRRSCTISVQQAPAEASIIQPCFDQSPIYIGTNRGLRGTFTHVREAVRLPFGFTKLV